MAKTTTQTKQAKRTFGQPKWATPQTTSAKGKVAAMPTETVGEKKSRAKIFDDDDFFDEGDVVVGKVGKMEVIEIPYTPSPAAKERRPQKPVEGGVYHPPRHHNIRYPAVPPPGRKSTYSGPRSGYVLFIPLDAPTPILKVSRVLCGIDKQGIVAASGLSLTSVKEALKGGGKVGMKVLLGFQTAAKSMGAELSLDDLEAFFNWVRGQRQAVAELPPGLKEVIKRTRKKQGANRVGAATNRFKKKGKW